MRVAAVMWTGTLFLAALAACGREQRPPSGDTTAVLVDTLEGVETIINPPTRRPDLGWTIGEPRLVLGRVDGDGPDVFGAIGGIVVDPDGRVFVGDAQAMEIRVFDADGAFSFAFGRKGEGPGEFENIDAMRLTPGAELLVRDVEQGRVSAFGLDGTFRRQFRIERPFLQYQTRPTLWADTAGRIYDWLQLSPGVSDTMGVAVYDSIGTPLNRVVTDAFQRRMIRVLQGERPIAGMPVPMTPFATAAVDRGGRIISGVGDTYELEVRNAGGELVSRIRRGIEPVAVPDGLADTVRARIASLVERMGGGSAEAYELPETRPAFTHVMTDDLDDVWVARDGDQVHLPTRYDIFGPHGRYRGSLTLPPLRLMQLGRDFIAGISYDELGVERAVVLPLERG